jgi:hypothetical protein
MELIDQLMQILEARPDLPFYQRAVLKAAISFLDQEHKCVYKNENWRVRLTPEEVDALPGEGWEFFWGQPHPK